MYANTHNDRFPDSFADLLADPATDLTPDALVCPSSKETSATGPTTQQWVARLNSEPGHLSYVYVGKGLTNKADANMLVAYEPVGHHGDSCNMLFVDGHVEFVSSTTAKAIITQAASRPTTTTTRP